MSVINKTDFGYDLQLKITSNDTSLDLSAADEITFIGVSNTTPTVKVEGEATWDAVNEVYRYTVQEDDFPIKDSYTIRLVFVWKTGEVVDKQITGRFGVLQIV
jgi:hypothetical protein